MDGINHNDTVYPEYIINIINRDLKSVKTYFLHRRGYPDTTVTPIYSKDYMDESKYLMEEQVTNILLPEVLSTFQWELKLCQNVILHIYPRSMCHLSKLGVLPISSLKLADDIQICTFINYGKSKNCGTIRRENDNKPDETNQIYKIHSAQSCL